MSFTEGSLVSVCPYCGNTHQGLCPRIKRIEYDGLMVVRSIEFHDVRKASKDRKDLMVDYLLMKVDAKDWHGVADAAMDLREIDAAEGRQSTATQALGPKKG